MKFVPTVAGQQAEQLVADYLTQEGFRIIGQNWKTTICEIDIVSQRDDVIYFVEVKYRGSTSQGDGFDYIGRQKIKQMEFAARVWCQANEWAGDYRLVAAAVSDGDVELIELS